MKVVKFEDILLQYRAIERCSNVYFHGINLSKDNQAF